MYEEDITINDILDDMRNAMNTNDSDVVGMTAEEFSESLEIGIKKTRKMLKKMVRGGQLKCTRKQIIDVAGRKNYTYIYHK